jgi:hypothetical protein
MLEHHREATPAQAPFGNTTAAMPYFPGSAPVVTMLKKLPAIEYYKMDLKGQAKPASGDKTRGDLVISCFNAVALQSEKERLKDPLLVSHPCCALN